MEIRIQELIPLQREANHIVYRELGREAYVEELFLAFNTELFEFLNSIGTWKWWKKSHEINRERVVGKLSDCLTFFISLLQLIDDHDIDNKKPISSPDYEEEIQNIIDMLDTEKTQHNMDQFKIVNNWSLVIGGDHEATQHITTTQRMAIAIFLVMQVCEGITWEEITEVYIKKTKTFISQNGGK